MSSAAQSVAGSRFSLRRFRRVTSSGKFIPEIDGLRFVAILLVYLFHLNRYVQEKAGPFSPDPSLGILSRVLKSGAYGVPLFFVISGFVLALPFASCHLRSAEPVSLRAYFLRRLTRLEPPYALCMILLFVLSVLYAGRNALSLFPRLAASLVYLNGVIYGSRNPINNIAWSLEIEVQFYLLVPLLTKIFAIGNGLRRRLAIGSLIVATISIQSIVDFDTSWRLSHSLLNYLQFFLIGFLLADVYLSEWNSKPTQTRRWDLVSLVGWPLLPVLWSSPGLSRWLFPPITFVLYCAAFRGAHSRKLFSNVWITTIGGMCYSIYLLHYPLISFVGKHSAMWRITSNFSLGFGWQFLLITPAVLAVNAGYFALIERPCMDPAWARKVMAALRR